MIDLMMVGTLLNENVGTNQRKMIQAFLVRLQEGNKEADGYSLECHHEARLRMFPKGYFVGSARNVLASAKQLSLHISDTSYIRLGIGRELGWRLQLVMGNLRMGPFHSGPYQSQFQTTALWESDASCDGLPETPKYPAKQCGGYDGCEKLSFIGTLSRGKDHVFSGMYLCENCQNDMSERVVDTLRCMTEMYNMVLTQNQWETYSRLLERKRRTQEKSKRKWATTLEPSRSSVAMTVTPNENIDPNIVESVAVAISGW